MQDNSGRYNKLYGQANDGIILHTGEQIVYANASAARILQTGNPASLIGKCIYDFIPAYSREIARNRFKLLLDERITLPRVEDRMMRLDGSLVDTEISAGYIDVNNSERLVQVVFQDISMRKKMERDLKASKAELDRAQKISHMGSWEWDVPRRKLYWSDETFRILGLEPSDRAPVTEALLEYVHAEDRKRVRKFLSEAKAWLNGGMIDFRIIARDGKLKHIHMEGDIEFDEQGNPLRAFGAFHDVTGRKLFEEELKDAKAQAELYLDLMGHDINNMNQIAMGYLELAMDIVNEGGSINRDNLFLVEKPMETLRSNSRLISNVRKVRREQAGAYKPEVIDITTLLESVRDEFSGITGRYVEINVIARRPPRVKANELLKDVFGNLVGNAIKHSDPGKALIVNIYAGVAVSNGKPYCRVAIEDNGPGIPDDLKRQLFDRLSLDRARTSGKGLGLCLTDMLVRDFGGRLTVESRVLEDYTQGSRFIVMLPVAKND